MPGGAAEVYEPAALTIVTGSIHVANSQRDVGATTSWGYSNTSTTIMNSMSIVLGNAARMIGAGAISNLHLPALQAREDCEIVGIADSGLTLTCAFDDPGQSLATETIDTTLPPATPLTNPAQAWTAWTSAFQKRSSGEGMRPRASCRPSSSGTCSQSRCAARWLKSIC